jgi:cellulose biosynthesis protein BcsQ
MRLNFRCSRKAFATTRYSFQVNHANSARSDWETMLKESYAVWNNKGGVGKSTITFHVASRYAETNPNVNVLVVDLCPQSNASMMLFGGGATGESEVLAKCSAMTPPTVVGYLSAVIAGGAGAPLPNPMSFLSQVSSVNSSMPPNIFLMCGDGNLEPMSPAISAAAAAPALTSASEPWAWIHLIFRKMIDSVVAETPEKDWVVFVDTNPSFSIYTELAVSAVNRLITPVNADDSSRVATNAMFILLHGQTPPHAIYGSWTFAAKAQLYKVRIPEIHLIVGNRLTQYGGAAAAFGALSDATANTLFTAYQSHPLYFTTRSTAPSTVDDFRQLYSTPLRDFNTAGVVSAHLGRRLSSMTGGDYQVHGRKVQVNKERVTECLGALDTLLTFV